MPITPVSLFGIWTREKLTRAPMTRTPEPGLVMDDPAQVEAYSRAGEPGGAMGGFYAFSCAHMLDVIAPGSTVLDLGCGPAHHLIETARLDPDSRFIGVDLSLEMLAVARANVRGALLDNVELRQDDMSKLEGISDASVDTVISSGALHHLATLADLDRTMATIRRVLKPGGGVFLLDFCRLRSPASLHTFVDAQQGVVPDLVIRDYADSMRAAFSLADFHRSARALNGAAELYTMSPVPFLAALKSSPRRARRDHRGDRLAMRRTGLSSHAANDLKILDMSFSLGGMRNTWL